MAIDEFGLIEDYFGEIGAPSANLRLGIGDDGAVVELPPGQQLVVAMDTLVEGIHFPSGTAAGDIAYKALAVNLSDLAAMAAEADWFQLSLTLPTADASWLDEFARSLDAAARAYGVALIGGDTCRGPLAITVQVAGTVPTDAYLTRAGASPGDLVVVSGRLGDAGLGLACTEGRAELPSELAEACLRALNRPHPRLELVPFLRAQASAAIDLSDGLQGDLRHILRASDCGARLERDALPVNDYIRRQGAWEYALGAGDDYEICCCVPPAGRAAIAAWNTAHADCPLSVIGEITAGDYLLEYDDQRIDLATASGFRHFG